MCLYFKTETDVVQNLIDDFLFFQLWLSEDLSIRRIVSNKNYGGTGLLSEKTEALHVEPNERAEAATSSYSAAVDFIQCIYSVFVIKNH